MQTIKLSNGYEIPALGYGTWNTPDGDVATDSIKYALSKGYRHIDTAAIYKNEASVGKGIALSGVKREDIFLTSKVWNTHRGYEKTMCAFFQTIRDLNVEYLDLYLIHWPATAHHYDNWESINLSTWSALTELYRSGKVKAIGVSNFKPHHLKALMQADIKPMINQIEMHPGMLQEETVEYCKEHDIAIEAWAPLGRGKLLSNPTLVRIAEKYQKSVAQLCIRWCLQHGAIPLPKSVTPSRIDDNLDVFDFEISHDDMVVIDSLKDIEWSGQDPDKIEF